MYAMITLEVVVPRTKLSLTKRCQIGERIGRWTVIADAGTAAPDKRHVWLCRCDCGVERIVRQASLRSINRPSLSCGCYRDDLLRERLSGRPYERLYKLMKKRAAFLGCNCMAFEEFLELTAQKECHYCGGPIDWVPLSAGNKGRNKKYFIDRVDNTGSYTLDNAVVCCSICNMAKGSLTVEQFQSMCQRVAQRLMGQLPESSEAPQ